MQLSGTTCLHHMTSWWHLSMVSGWQGNSYRHHCNVDITTGDIARQKLFLNKLIIKWLSFL